jgi:heptosyltransferase-3
MTYLKDAPDFSKLKKVLIIKLRHLGDVVLSTPVYHTLKKRFPHLEIDVLVNEESKGLLEGIREISNVLTYKRPKEKGLLKKVKAEVNLFKNVLKTSYDLVLNLTEGDKGNLLAILSRAKNKVALEGSSHERFMTHLYKRTGNHRHSVERDLDAIRRLGVYPSESEKKLLVPSFTEELGFVLQFLKDNQVQDFVVIHPVSRWLYKSPQASFFVDLIKNSKRKFVITGFLKGNEGKYIEAILQACPNAVYFPSGGCFKKLLCLLDQAKGLITVDSLPLHLSSALKIKTIALFGPTSEQDWGPWENNHAKVVTYEKPCRSCYKDGCGGGKLASCLDELKQDSVRTCFQSLFQEEL